MESIISDKLSDYLSLNGLISKEQHGFLVKRSTGTQLLECFQDWFHEIHNKKAVDIVYIEYSRAFDSLVHAKLLIGWIKCYLQGRTQSVSIDGHVSTTFESMAFTLSSGHSTAAILLLYRPGRENAT